MPTERAQNGRKRSRRIIAETAAETAHCFAITLLQKRTLGIPHRFFIGRDIRISCRSIVHVLAARISTIGDCGDIGVDRVNHRKKRFGHDLQHLILTCCPNGRRITAGLKHLGEHCSEITLRSILCQKGDQEVDAPHQRADLRQRLLLKSFQVIILGEPHQTVVASPFTEQSAGCGRRAQQTAIGHIELMECRSKRERTLLCNPCHIYANGRFLDCGELVRECAFIQLTQQGEGNRLRPVVVERRRNPICSTFQHHGSSNNSLLVAYALRGRNRLLQRVHVHCLQEHYRPGSIVRRTIHVFQRAH